MALTLPLNETPMLLSMSGEHDIQRSDELAYEYLYYIHA